MKVSLYFILFVAFFRPVYSQSSEVVINEFMASNSSSAPDPDFGAHSDWLEIFNPSAERIDLSHWFLTDDLNNPGKWQIPEGTQIDAGRYLIFWADGNDVTMVDHHANFRLSKSGEAIGLFDADTSLIDSIVYENQVTDISFGRQPDGGPAWDFLETPTPGGANSSTSFLRAAEPQFSLPAGFYTENQVLEITTDDTLATIRYTINGNDPTVSSPVYSAPISLKSRSDEANVFSMIRTNRDPYLWLPDWVPPGGEVFKANVIRAKSFRDGYEPSTTVTSTFFVDPDMENRYSTLPVISIVSDYKHLFDNNTGIYVPGVYHIPGNSGSGNYFRDWEKPAHIEFFEPGGNLGFGQDVGISIQGGTSPASPQKGLHVIARSEYGKNRINYPIFKNDPSKARDLAEYKRFIIRAWGSLITGSLFNDAYAHRLMAKGDLDIQAYQPAVVFINGEYWGLHGLREANKNSWYYQYHYEIDRDNPGVDILIHSSSNGQPYPGVDEGDNVHWLGMINYINTHDMKLPENYDYIKTRIDVDNFISYLVHCIYVGKWDWPNNNDASWRERTIEGKWRWIQYDMETGFGVATGLGPGFETLGPQLNMLKAAIVGVDIPGFGKYGPHPVLARIHDNEEFKDSFIEMFDYRMDHEFHPDSMNQLLEEMAAEIRPYMQEYKERWPFIRDLDNEWANSLESIKEFNNLRPDYMRDHLAMYEAGLITSLDEYRPQADYALYQNFPNPFSAYTSIGYRIPREGQVVIRIHNMNGQILGSFERRHSSGGFYTLDLDAGDYPNGLYFVTIEVDGFRDVRKMVLSR